VKKADFYFNVARLPVDFVMLIIAGITTYILRTKILDVYRPVLFEFNLPLLKYLYLVVAVSVIFILFFTLSGLYSMKQRMRPGEEFAKIFVASAAGIMAIIIYIFLRQELFNSRFLVLGGWFFAVLFVLLGRILVRFIQNQTVAKYNFGIHRLLVVGDDPTTKKLMYEIVNNPFFGYRLVKHLDSPVIAEIANAIGNPGIDEVILGNPNVSEDKITELIELCNENHIIFKFVPNVYQTLTKHFDIDVIHNVPLIELKRTSLDGWGRVAKRILDMTFALMALVFLSPIFALCALAIRWEGPGPIFVKLRRVSKNKEFSLYKFRSMVPNAEELKPALAALNERNDGPLFKMANDPRITKVGRILRKFRFDEMPQFWNVLKGDISLVGPRPHQPDEISRYHKHHKKVLAIDAGATGLAQISGSSNLPFEEEVTLDSFYIENWSLWMDLKIIGKTVYKIFSDRSAV